MKTIMEETGQGEDEYYIDGYVLRKSPSGAWVENPFGEGTNVSTEQLLELIYRSTDTRYSVKQVLDRIWPQWF